MEKENSIYRELLALYENVVSEQYFINQDNAITSIDIGILGDTNYLIQVKHGSKVNTTQALKAFCFDCESYNDKAVKIWYTEFAITDKSFKNICDQRNVMICHSFDDLVEKIREKKIDQNQQNEMQLRDYQKDAVENVLHQPNSSGIIVFPPGCGKTITALEICTKLYINGFKKIVWTTRRKELLIGGFNDLESYKNMPIYNTLTKNGKFNKYNLFGLYVMNHEKFITLLNQQQYLKPNYVIVDECHETGAAEIYKALESLKQNKIPILGLSATPYTGNLEHQNNVRKLFPEIFAELNIFDAIDLGYALPLEFIFNNDVISAIKKVKTNLPWFKAIAWCSTIDNCDSYTELLIKEFPELQIFSSHSKNDSINKNIIDFKKCKADSILVCVNKAREGWNDPRINCVVHLDEVQNRAFNVSIQTGNRANRTFPGKTRAIVIDCVNRDPVDVILSYYFAYNPKSLFREIQNKLKAVDNSIYYNGTKLFDVCIESDFNAQFTIEDYITEIQTRIFGKSEYGKFIEKFQEFLYKIDNYQKIPASYDSYLGLVKNRNDFLPNPVLEFPKLSWAEVFGKPLLDILEWNDFKRYCVNEYASNPIHSDLPKFYKSLCEKNKMLPENPADAYKSFRNLPDLFGIRTHWRR